MKKKKAKKAKVKKAKKLTTSKVCCTICKECKGMSKARKEKLIGVFGSLEEVHAKYVCRKCRKAENVRRDGRKKPEKRKRKPKLVTKWRDPITEEIILPDWMKTICSNDYGKKEKIGVSPVRTWKKPEDVSDKEWNKALKSTIKYGKAKGILKG